MIQPAFMFMVGVAMPFALARRMEQGATFRTMWRHVAVRSLRLLAPSEIIMCIHRDRAHLQLTNVLAQVAFTHFLCFLIMQLRFRRQVLAAAALLGGHWALFAAFPGPQGPFSKDGNIGAVIDTVTTLFGVWTNR